MLTSQKTNLFFAWQAFLYFDEVSSIADQEFQSVAASLQTTKSVNNNINQLNTRKQACNCTYMQV